MKGLDTLIFDERRKMPLLSKEEEYGSNLKATNNLSDLSELTEKSIVDTLKARCGCDEIAPGCNACRYVQDVIYTYIGDILLACNPFKPLTIYSPKFQDVFLPSSQRFDLMPHIFALALVCDARPLKES